MYILQEYFFCRCINRCIITYSEHLCFCSFLFKCFVKCMKICNKKEYRTYYSVYQYIILTSMYKRRTGVLTFYFYNHPAPHHQLRIYEHTIFLFMYILVFNVLTIIRSRYLFIIQKCYTLMFYFSSILQSTTHHGTTTIISRPDLALPGLSIKFINSTLLIDSIIIIIIYLFCLHCSPGPGLSSSPDS